MFRCKVFRAILPTKKIVLVVILAPGVDMNSSYLVTFAGQWPSPETIDLAIRMFMMHFCIGTSCGFLLAILLICCGPQQNPDLWDDGPLDPWDDPQFSSVASAPPGNTRPHPCYYPDDDTEEDDDGNARWRATGLRRL